MDISKRSVDPCVFPPDGTHECECALMMGLSSEGCTCPASWPGGWAYGLDLELFTREGSTMTLPKKEAEAATTDDLSLEQLTDLVGEASGWGERASISFRRDVDRASVPHKSYVSACVEICGGKMTVSATGADHRKALIVLLQNIESNHREILRWHKQRCVRAREILDAQGIYYVKVDL